MTNFLILDIVKLEGDYNMENVEEKELNIPKFAQREFNRRSSGERAGRKSPEEMRETYQRTRNQSVKSDTVRAQRSKKKTKSISPFQAFKKELSWLGIGVAITLGAFAVSKVGDVQTYFEEQAIVSDTMDEYYDIVDEYKKLVTDASGKPVYHDGNQTSYWYDNDEIGKAMKDKLSKGASEIEVVYGIYSNMVNTKDDVDDFYKAMKEAGLKSGENEWAHLHGYDDMKDSELKKDAKREMVREHKASEYHNSEIDAMLSDSVADTHIDSSKAMGGK